MKKIFSAFLLMTMMVASVGSFVSCSDIEDAIAKVENTANDNAAQIKDLEGKIAALQTALATAQADAAAAKAEANAAKQAAATAKAEAIEAALAEIAKVQDDVDAANAEIKKINDALAGYATKEAVELLENTVATYKALTDKNAEAIEAIEAELAALKEAGLTAEKFAEVVAKMEQIDKDLVAFVDALKDLANRIQSITWVPTKVGQTSIEPYGFKIADPAGSDKYTPVMIQATYQVAPAELAAEMANAEVFFSSTPVTKAAEITFDAEVIDVDEERGQFTVRGYITKDSEAYNRIVNATTDRVAVALNVVTDASATVKEETIETGSYVTSAYTDVEDMAAADLFDNVYDLIYLVKPTATGVASVAHTGANVIGYEVAYNDTASERALFSDLMFVVNFAEDGRMTLEDAGKLLGTELVVTYDEATVAHYNASETAITAKKPISVTGKDLTATAKIVKPSDDNNYKAENYINYYSTVTIGGFKVNKYNAIKNVQAVTAKYTIVREAAAIMFETVKHNWKPSETSLTDYAWNGTEFTAVELAATSAIDLTNVTFKPYPTYNETYFGGALTNGTFVALNVVNNQLCAAYATVETLSKKAVKLTGVNIPYFAEKPMTWQFVGLVTKDNTDYTVVFNVEMSGMPKDKEINLGPQEVVLSNTDMTVSVPALAKILEADAAYYGDKFGVTGFFQKDADDNVTDVPAIQKVTAGHATVLRNNEPAAVTSYDINVVPAIKRDAANKPWYESSTIKLAANAEYAYGDEFIISQKYHFAGVTYTFKSIVEIVKPTVSIVPNPTYVKDGVVTLGGKVTYPTSTEAAKTAGTAFELNKVDLRDYVNVTVPSGKEADYKIKYTLKTQAVKYDGTNYTTLPALAAPASKGLSDAAVVDWTGSKLNEVEYEIALTNTAGVVLGEPVKVKLQIPELVVLSLGESVKSTYTNNVASTANVAGALVVKDKDGNSIYNAGFANSLVHAVADDVYLGVSGYFAEYYSYDKDGNKTGVSKRQRITDGWKMYGQTFALPMKNGAVDKSKITVTVNGAAATIDYTITEDGTITVGANNANVTGDIVFTVPVSMNYDYDGYAAQTVNAQVVFEVK